MRTLERLMGPPMAAPESVAMRRLRLTFIVLSATTTIGMIALQLLVGLLGRPGAGAALGAAMIVTIGVGLFYFVRKSKIDDLWILRRVFDNDGEGA